MQVILKDEIIQKLKEVGLKSGDTVMVHTSLGKMGYVCGGAQAVIEALMEVVGDSGTIMMPTQSWKNLDPETGVHWEPDQKDWQLIRDNWPAYDKNLTPTNTMGAVAEMFRQLPGSVRSDHPARSVCAWGRYAEYPGKHTCVEHSAVSEEGKRVWKAYETLFVDGNDFEKIGEDFEKAYAVPGVRIGNALVRLMYQRELVDFAVKWMETNRA